MSFPIDSFKEVQVEDEPMFPHLAVQRFFQQVLVEEYHAEDWNVVIEPTRTSALVNASQKLLALPPKPFPLSKVRDLLAEEIEVHIYRSLSGSQSPLALLGLGLARSAVTEEGLTEYYTQPV